MISRVFIIVFFFSSTSASPYYGSAIVVDDDIIEEGSGVKINFPEGGYTLEASGLQFDVLANDEMLESGSGSGYGSRAGECTMENPTNEQQGQCSRQEEMMAAAEEVIMALSSHGRDEEAEKVQSRIINKQHIQKLGNAKVHLFGQNFDKTFNVKEFLAHIENSLRGIYMAIGPVSNAN